MVALKTLQSQWRMGTLSSRVMLGILVVQDLTVVPLMILLPALSSENANLTQVATATLRALALLGGIVLVSTQVVPRLLAAVARGQSRELFMLTTTAIALGVGVVAWRLGLSLALGAFIAGLIINESDYAHQALSDIIPLRDLFGMLFFVSAGMLLDPALAWRQLGMLATIVAAVVIGKGAILAGVVALFGYRRVIPLATGLTLFQVGEFAFVLAGVGRATGALSNEVYALVLNTAIVTMALTPALSATAAHVYTRLHARRPEEAPLTMNVSSEELTGHVVIAGAGRVGRLTADALSSLHLPFILIESDGRRLEQARNAGLPVIYGDAAQPTLLEAAALVRARMLVITVPSFPDVHAIVATAQTLRADVPIAARAESGEAVRSLHELGIHEVTSPEFEAAVDMTRRALVQFDMSPNEIMAAADAIRRRHYSASGQT